MKTTVVEVAAAPSEHKFCSLLQGCCRWFAPPLPWDGAMA